MLYYQICKLYSFCLFYYGKLEKKAYTLPCYGQYCSLLYYYNFKHTK